eukprot:Tamp_27474.p2 GENE.Tamp_27474~~Tamp_27474.p2  ORF type:complete len:106 (+),score=7.61 Tamp_27474:360-677(+)
MGTLEVGGSDSHDAGALALGQRLGEQESAVAADGSRGRDCPGSVGALGALLHPLAPPGRKKLSDAYRCCARTGQGKDSAQVCSTRKFAQVHSEVFSTSPEYVNRS